ncbi:MAG: response regulator [Syntrophobacteraceae bacterium]
MSEAGTDRPSRIRLLLVDDEKEYVNVLSKRMARRSIDVVPAHSGSEALRVLRGGSFDVVILDLKMEDMDGIDVLRIFKKMDPALPVIMLTGHGSERAAREGVELGAFDYLMKPCDFDILVDRIRAACLGEEG